MKLPEELKQAYIEGKRLFSWIREFKGQATSLTLYQKSSDMFLQMSGRFYWQTPTKELSLVGLGTVLTFKGDEATLSSLTTNQNKMAQRLYQNKTIYGTGALLLGALAFNQADSQCRMWHDLERGYFYLPRVLITESKTDKYVTVNFEAESLEALEQGWIESEIMCQQLEQVSEDARPDIAQHGYHVKTQELAVNQWLSLVAATISKIKEETNPIKKIVLARHLEVVADEPIKSEVILANLARQQTNTYLFALESNQAAFVGATPERLLSADHAYFKTAGIAGSAPRGKTMQADQALSESLLTDAKNIYEHRVVIERIENELADLVIGDLIQPELSVLKNRDIQHLFIPIKGRRRAGVSLLDGIDALHPTPALGGEPKKEALAWIAEKEMLGRGLYGAPIGWLSLAGDEGEFAVGIRSGIFSENGGLLYGGCGIVEESVPELELKETEVKFQPMLRGVMGE